MNYHSRLPVISAWTGDGVGLAAAGNIKTAVAPSIIGTYLTTLASGSPADLTQLVTAGVMQGATVSQAGAIAQTVLGLAAAVPPTAIADVLTNPANPYNASIVKAVTASATDAFAKTAHYQVEYPEDIQLFGASFNTVLPKSGIALQGEVSHRLDVPLQADDIELLFAAMGPLSPAFATYNQFATHDGIDTSAAALAANGYGPIYIPGYRLLDVTQIQTTATKLFGPIFGADQFTFVGEIGLTYVHGTTPGPGGNFVDGRKTVTLGLGADYQNQWSADLSYTNYFGAGRYNLVNDRDFVAMNIKYSF
jgi:hypothetical protein